MTMTRLPPGSDAQDRRVAEVVVGSDFLRAILYPGPATDQKGVSRRHLVPPDYLPGLQIHRDHRVAGLDGGTGVRVTGADVEDATLGIDRRRVPDRCARRRVLRGAFRILPDLHGRFGDGVTLPDLIAGRRVERDDTAAERAALVAWLRAGPFFNRRHGNVQLPVVQRHRPGDARETVRIDRLLPEELTSCGVERVRICLEIAEIHDVSGRGAGAERCDGRSRTDARVGLERPVRAARVAVDGIEVPTIAAHEHAARHNRRIAVGLRTAREAERPLQLEIRDVRSRDARILLEPAVVRVHAESVPGRAGPISSEPRLLRCARVGVGYRRAERFTRQILGERTLLGHAERDGLHAHAAARHGHQDRVGAAILECGLRRRPSLRLVVTLRAGFLVDRLGIDRLRRRTACADNDAQPNNQQPTTTGGRRTPHGVSHWRLPVKVPSPSPTMLSVPLTSSLLTTVPL